MTNDETRTNTLIRLTPCRNMAKGRALLAHLEGTGISGSELYRVRDAESADRMVELLKRTGRKARTFLPIHSKSEKIRIRIWYANETAPALIASGPLPFPDDRDDVRRLFVMNLPPSLENAAADLAVTGRDGLSSEAEFFASAEDRVIRLAEIPASARKRLTRLEQAVNWLENDGCARVFLARTLHGKDIGVCGNCSWCLGRPATFLP